MSNQKLLNILQQGPGHFEPVGNAAVGMIGNIPATVILVNGYLQVTLALTDPDKKRLYELASKSIRQAKSNIGKVGVLTMSGTANGMAERFYASSEVLETVFRENNFVPSDLCPICNEYHCDSVAMHKNIYTHVHRDCVEKLHKVEFENVTDNAINGSYAGGVVGGLLGGLAASLLCAIIIVLTKTMFAALYALIPPAIYWGYKKMKGRMDRFVTIFTVVTSFVMGVACNYLSALYALLDNFNGRSFPLTLILSALFSGEMFALLVEDMLYSLLFVGVGLYSTWQYINKTGSSYIEDGRQVLATMKPLTNTRQEEVYDNTTN